MKCRSSIIVLLLIIPLLTSSCLRDIIKVVDSFRIHIPDSDKEGFWYKLTFEKDTLLFPQFGDTTYICSNTMYYKPAVSRPHRIETLYEFGFEHIADTNGHQHAVFSFDIEPYKLDYYTYDLNGYLISDTSFFEVARKYHYTAYEFRTSINDTIHHRKLDSYFQHGSLVTPSFWYSFSTYDSDNDTAYTLNFEFDSPIWDRETNHLVDTFHIRNGKLHVSRKYEDYVWQNKDVLNYYYQTSEGFIK